MKREKKEEQKINEDQKQLFEAIKLIIGSGQSLANVLMDKFGFKSSTVYRYINGETDLNFSQFAMICREYNMSMDGILNIRSNEGILFRSVPIDNPEQFSNFELLKSRVERWQTIKKDSEAKIICAARRIPFYHAYQYPELLFFHLFACNDTYRRTSLTFETFCTRIENSDTLPLYRKIRDSVSCIPVTEIWSKHTIDGILKGVKYFYRAGVFESADTVLMLLNRLKSLFKTLSQYAESGYISKQNIPFRMYVCNIDFENNMLLVKKGEKAMFAATTVYLNNTIETSHTAVCSDAEKIVDDIIAKSTLISGGSSLIEKERFFRTMQDKIDRLANRIKTNQSAKEYAPPL